MSRFGSNPRTRQVMIGLIAAAVLVSLLLPGALLLNSYEPPDNRFIAGATSAAATATADKARLATAAAPSPTRTATVEPTTTPGPTATSPILPPGTRLAVATARAEAQAVAAASTRGPGWESEMPGVAGGAADTPASATPSPQPTPAFIAIDLLPSPTPTAVFPEQLAGKVVFLSNMTRTQTRAYAIDRDGFALAQLTADWPLPRAAERDTWSPDRFYRVAVGRNLETGQVRLEIRDGESDDPVAVIASGPVSSPAWSPVADQIAFVSSEGGNENIWVVNADGRGKRQLTANRWQADQHPSWSPDGSQIVFTSNRNGKRQVWIMNADGSDQRPLTGEDYEAWDPVWVKYQD